MMQHKGDPQATLPFLLEIGSEEIPARFIPGAMKALQTGFAKIMADARLDTGKVRVMATPRRLVLVAEAVTLRQADREQTIKGPPVSVAFGPNGEPTPAAEGFARKAGIELADCERGEDQRGEFLLARVMEPGREAGVVLAETAPDLILGLPFRKVMRWADYDLEYPRPLQWLVALLGEEIVPCRVDYLEAGRTTRGHRTLVGDATFSLSAVGDYPAVMEQAGVVVDPELRRTLITDGLDGLLKEYSGDAELIVDAELLDEVVFLCEHPTPFLGAYAEEYFALPAEVIATALKAHQRYFTVRDRENGKLLPRFAAVRDGGGDHLDNVIAGNERVLRARLADALFYWNFDQQKSPDERTELLESVTWMEGFGTVLDKSRRLVALSSQLWVKHLSQGAEAPVALTRAALICKNDLTSEMIRDGKEFTKLEGFMGARYAERAGEDPAVARAIEFHYAPRSATGDLPQDDLSCCLSLADRLDTLCGCWLAGFVPTGAKDPYGLRRHVLAMVRILLDRGWHLDLRLVLEDALAGVGEFATGQGLAASAEEIAEFIRVRLEGYFIDSLGQVPEVVRAILPVRWFDPVAARAWSEALAVHRQREDFLQAAVGFKRCRNILKGDILPVDQFDPCLQRWLSGGSGAAGENFAGLGHPVAEGLRRMTAAAAGEVALAEAEGRMADVFAILSDLGPAIDKFFETVRVLDDNESLQAARIAFLREIHGLFARYGDFQEMVATDN